MNRLQKILTREAKHKAELVAVRVRKYFLGQGKTPDIRDYPSVVAVCAKMEYRTYTGETMDIDRKKINRMLLGELEWKLGPIGTKTCYADNSYVGYCAEPNAANKLLKREGVNSLDDIYFGKAYRPRTGVVIPPCGNCQRIFNNVVR